MHLKLEKQKAYKTAYDIACDQLLHSDMEVQFHNAGLRYSAQEEKYTVEIPFFDEIITLKVPQCTFRSSRGVNVTLVSKIIMLHYINTASGNALGGDKIPYEDIRDCRAYLPVFESRVTKPLTSAFGYNKDAFLEAGIALGGSKEEYGDTSFTLNVLPNVPITFILWEGDAEFPPSVKILFDPSINRCLPLEDIVIMCKLAYTRIMKKARMKYSDDVFE